MRLPFAGMFFCHWLPINDITAVTAAARAGPMSERQRIMKNNRFISCPFTLKYAYPIRVYRPGIPP